MSAELTPQPRVAVIGIVQDGQGRLVAGRRIGPLGGGQYSFPGGHLEFGEDIFACVERETLEETGLVVKGVKVLGVTNDLFPENDKPGTLWKHYISIFTECVRVDPEQQPQRMEPNKCEGWDWTSLDDIKSMAADDEKAKELFLPVVNFFRSNLIRESAVPRS